MIQRFNFYDVYGYLIPGLAIVALLSLPSALITGHLQDERLGWWLALAVAVAYVLGHVIQNLAANAVSSRVARDADGTASYPSTTMLDPTDKELDPEIKRRVKENVASWFGIDVALGQHATAPIGKQRAAAFALCRPIVNARTTYAEQYEGLYTMARGLFIAFSLCAVYMVGWVAACYKPPCALALGLFVVKAALLFIVIASVVRSFSWGLKNRRAFDTAILVFIAIALGGAGVIAGTDVAGAFDENFTRLCYAAAAIYAVVALRFLLLYRYFSIQFSKAVWVNFAAEPTQRPTSDAPKLLRQTGGAGEAGNPDA